MVLSQRFEAQDQVIASYSNTEILTKLGQLRFYLAVTSNNAGVEYLLTTETVYSGSEATTRSSAGTTTLTFDSEVFEEPRTCTGNAVFNIAIKTGTSTSGYVTAQLYKYDGSTATALSSEITSTTVGGGGATQANVLLQLPITADTLIKEGEQVRIVVKCVYVGGGAAIYWSHDPKGRQTFFTESEEVGTDSSVTVPFRREV